MINAPCRGSDTNFFFPDVGVSVHHTRAIRDLCDACPVQPQCLELGLESGNDEYGFFGGKSPRERQAINAERKRLAYRQLREASRLLIHEPAEALDVVRAEQESMARSRRLRSL